MEKQFWHQKWEKKEIAFHEHDVNPLLRKYFFNLKLQKESRIFLPLCGKTLDISWLVENGYKVVGAELSKLAIEELFEELKQKPQIQKLSKFTHYKTDRIDIYVGDIFDLTNAELGSIDAIYDRAALVALPKEMRTRYSAHLIKISHNAPQLLICYEYDQTVLNGPPFSIVKEEVFEHYSRFYGINLLESAVVPGGLRGKTPATENVWVLEQISS